MAKAEGLTLPFVGEDHIQGDLLEVFPYKGPNQVVTYTTHEFSAVCPFSGLPDLGTVIIEYVPAKSCVELKSLKYYYMSYRNVGLYQEAVIARIYKDLDKVLKPQRMKITVTYQTRGGIDTTCVISSDDNRHPTKK